MKKFILLLLTVVFGIHSTFCSGTSSTPVSNLSMSKNTQSSSNCSETDFKVRLIDEKINAMRYDLDKIQSSVNVLKGHWGIFWALTLASVLITITAISHH